jgi:hypothetical protein
LDTERTTLAFGSLLFGMAFLDCYLKSLNIRQMTDYSVEIFLQGICAEQQDYRKNTV